MMNETVEKTFDEPSLNDLHRAADARMIERDGLALPADYGDALREYRVVRDGGAGVIDLSSQRATLMVSGGEAERFLNGMVTNDVAKLETGAWMLTAFPNVQGRLIAFARILRFAPDSFLLDTDRATHARILSTLERFTLAGDFHVRDVSAETICLSVQGERAIDLINTSFGAEAANIERGRVGLARWGDSSVTIIRATHTGEDGFDLFVETASAPALWNKLTESGVEAVGFNALEMLRIEAGLPRYSADMDETNVVLETGLDEAVSFTKGCYLGQEIIARIHYRGHVARRLAGLTFENEDSNIRPGATLRTGEGKDAGRITSLARSPRLNKTIALAYVRYAYLAPGTELIVVSEVGETRARVTELPFVRGSWFTSDATKDEAEPSAVRGGSL